MEHTKGEWKYRKDTRYHNVVNESGGTIVQCGTLDSSEANAHLIAAAPDMYEALKELVSDFKQGAMPNFDEIPEFEAILAKAEGKQ